MTAAAKMAADLAAAGIKIFWNNVKPIFDKNGNLSDILPLNSDEIPVNILMVGGRRSGKTSVLAAIYKEANNFLGSDSLTISTGTVQQSEVLAEKIDAMKSYFLEDKLLFVVDDTPTDDATEYNFPVSIKEQKGKHKT